jgi:CheY-like chemotaxis protein/anti-anti-sigma regulatory factor
MSMHFISHRREVVAVEDGLKVTLRQQDFDAPLLPDLFEDLLGLSHESSHSSIFLDFDNVHHLPSIAFSKLIALDGQLNEVGSKLVLCNVHPHLYECLQAAAMTDSLEVREHESANPNRHEVAIRVLLADPDEALLLSNRVFLSRRGFEVATATNGLDCLEKLREFKPDVLVLDPNMSWGQGDDILALMEDDADVPRVPALVLSGDEEAPHVRQGYSLQEHRAKPVSPDQLADRIRWLFECSPPPGGYYA